MTGLAYLSLEEVLVGNREATQVVAHCRDEARAWGQFDRDVRAWRSSIAGRGWKQVALYFSEAWDMAAALLGAWSAKATPILPGSNSAVVSADLEPHVDAFLGEFPERLKPILATPDRDGSGETLPRLDSELGFALFTSGSTGAKQRVHKKLRQLSAEVLCLEEAFGPLVQEAPTLATVSHQHIYGLLFKLLWPLCAGRAFESGTLFYPEQLIASAERFPAAVLVSSPTHLKRLPGHLDWSGLTWNAVFSSGGPLPVEYGPMVEKRLGKPAIDVFGSTETGGIAWREIGCSHGNWTTFADVELRIGGAGHLSLRSPKLLDSTWMATADRVAFDAQGRLEWLGRQDRIVKIEGRRLSLAAIETALTQTGIIEDAAALALQSSSGRDEIGAAVKLNDAGKRVERHTLRRMLRDSVALHVDLLGVPRQLRIVDALPRDAQDKLEQAALKALFAQRKDGLRNLPEILGVTTLEAHQRVMQLRIPANLRAFAGHFPAAPVLPGVVQVDWAHRYGLEQFSPTSQFCGLECLKFKRILQPGDEVELFLEYQAERGRLKFEYRSFQGRHASGILLFGAKVPV